MKEKYRSVAPIIMYTTAAGRETHKGQHIPHFRGPYPLAFGLNMLMILQW